MKKIISFIIAIVAILGIYNTFGTSDKAIATSKNTKTKKVQIGGQPFGIKFYSEGALITKVRDDSPADKSGLRENDIIIGINNEKVKNNQVVREKIKENKTSTIKFTINRDYEIIDINIKPENSNGKYTVGIWIKDSCAGIGTITYYDTDNNTFACLGHGICDKNATNLLPMSEGDICPAFIQSVDKAKTGYAGGLNGYFLENEIGKAYCNSQYGLFCNKEIATSYKEYEVATKNEIKKGKAYIYTTVEGDNPKFYEVKITPQCHFFFDKMKEITIEITDKELLNKTGGIVQGMSGSPIVQNDKLIGAVTHVFVNNPEKGYGILAETMLTESK